MKLEKILDEEKLNERIVTFGGNAFPKGGHLVIMAGGPGSGKGFALKNIVGVHGKTLNVDFAIEATSRFRGVNMKDAEKVREIYQEMKPKYKKFMENFFETVRKHKPNIIVDGTGKNIPSQYVPTVLPFFKQHGYETTLVYVHVSKDVAWKRNLKRERVVPRDIFDEIHSKVESSVKKSTRAFDNVWYVDNSGNEPNWWIDFPERVIKVK